jgi:hypothetical protein
MTQREAKRVKLDSSDDQTAVKDLYEIWRVSANKKMLKKWTCYASEYRHTVDSINQCIKESNRLMATRTATNEMSLVIAMYEILQRRYALDAKMVELNAKDESVMAFTLSCLVIESSPEIVNSGNISMVKDAMKKYCDFLIGMYIVIEEDKAEANEKIFSSALRYTCSVDVKLAKLVVECHPKLIHVLDDGSNCTRCCCPK